MQNAAAVAKALAARECRMQKSQFAWILPQICAVISFGFLARAVAEENRPNGDRHSPDNSEEPFAATKLKRRRKRLLWQGFPAIHTYLIELLHYPKLLGWACQPSHGLGASGVAGDASPRRPCAGQPAHFACSHHHYRKLASNSNDVKRKIDQPASCPWPACGGKWSFIGLGPVCNSNSARMSSRFVLPEGARIRRGCQMRRRQLQSANGHTTAGTALSG